MKSLVGAFNQEKALVGAFSVIVQPLVEPMEHYTALVAAVAVVAVVWKVLVRLSPGVHHHIAQSSRHHRHGRRHCRDIVTGKSETVKNVFFTGFWIYLSCVPLLV